MQYRNYKQYISSPKWDRKKKNLRRKFMGKWCRVCKTLDGVDTHHLRYPKWGKETVNDLVFLCRDCHYKIHNLKETTNKDYEILLEEMIKEDELKKSALQ